MKIKAAILGISGYTGQQLLTILSNHKYVKIDGIFGNNTIGKKIRDLIPSNSYIADQKILDYRNFDFSSIDIVFSCLPHKILQGIAEKINANRIIDLSADFRFNSSKKYQKHYHCSHNSPSLIKKFVYGLSEVNREQIRKSRFIANPGCYPTSVLIPLIPILRTISSQNTSIIVDAKSGISGAGKVLAESNLFVETNENIRPYKIFSHRHQPEIIDQIEENNLSCNLTFVPHILPISRGILSTIYLKNIDEDYKNLRETLEYTYKDDYFVEILSDGEIPYLKGVVGTNKISINIFEDKSSNTIVIISAIDNLIKGAAGQAIQNMNLMYNLDISESLKIISMIP